MGYATNHLTSVRNIPCIFRALQLHNSEHVSSYQNPETTLKRHGYYCRSRNGSSRPARSRSCQACAKAKARCDNKRPSCTRCTVKVLTCRTQTERAGKEVAIEVSSKQLPRTRYSMNDVTSTPRPPPTSRPLRDVDNVFTRSECPAIDLSFAGLGDLPQWSMLDITSSVITDLDDQLPYPSPLEFTELATDPSESLIDRNPANGRMILVQNTLPSIPTMPTYELRSFGRNPAIKCGKQTTAKLIVRILTSYPIMMQSRGFLPPFIHPSSLLFTSHSETRSMESLSTCMSLMQMIGTNAQASRRLLWKNVRLECERLNEEVSALSIHRKCKRNLLVVLVQYAGQVGGFVLNSSALDLHTGSSARRRNYA